MKSYLLDTHIFLNACGRPEKNGKKIVKILESDSPKYLSAISLVEIAQAASTGFTVLSDDTKFPFYPIELISNNS
jgi:PIN domain nuclease of toxin-antitoxin system